MSRNAIDFHTHAFPDDLAERAIGELTQGGAEPFLDGTTADLLRSMDEAGIDKSVICCIATKPQQFQPILDWCKEIASDRLVPFPSVHPEDPAPQERVRRVAQEGFRGMKLHAYYQDFRLDDERLFPIYEELQRQGLILVAHTGYDFAFPREKRAEPERILTVTEQYPELSFVSSHLGAWRDWDAVEEHMVGRNVYMETSFGAELLGVERAREILLSHPPDRLLFGTDSPWTDQDHALELIESMDLPPDLEAKIMRENAAELLGLE